jgi:hypothetical protein
MTKRMTALWILGTLLLLWIPWNRRRLSPVSLTDARTPKEIGYFVPPDPKIRIGTKPSRLVAQTEDVLVDRRGCIYISDKNLGIYILRLRTIWPYTSV